MGENSYYNDDDFWQKINAYARKAGRKLVDESPYASTMPPRIQRRQPGQSP